MILLPAIDIKGGECVRLYKGDFSTVHKVAQSPVETALRFAAAGARWLHMVDLDGARNGTAANTGLALDVVQNSGLQVELGGGIRTMEMVEFYLERGVARVVLGSAALKNPRLVREAVEAYGERIAVGIDAKEGMVATEGWVEGSDMDYLDLAKRMEDMGVQTLIFTDIARDGMLSGVNRERLDALRAAVSCAVVASGGVRDLEDVKACKAMGLYGAICGKSIYSGSLNLKEALELAGEQTC